MLIPAFCVATLVQMSDNAASSFENSFLMTVIGIVLLVDVVLFARTFRRRSVAAKLDKLERAVGLAIPEALRPSIARGIVRRHRIKYVVLFTVATMMAVVVSIANIPDTNYRVFLVVGSILAGSVVGVALGSMQWPARRKPGITRVAKAGAVGLDDYVPPSELRNARLLVVLALAVYLLSLLALATGTARTEALPPARTSALFVVIAVLFLCFFEVVGRRIVGRAQIAASEPELVWDDAMRAIDVRALASTPATIGLLSVLFGVSDLTMSLHEVLTRSNLLVPINVALWIGFAGWLVVSLASSASHPERYFLRRLWPSYAQEPLSDSRATSDRTQEPEHTESTS